MSQSRVEKFKEYRNSIYDDGEKPVKEKIDIAIEENSVKSKNGPSFQEELEIKKLITSRNVSNIFYFGFVVLIAALAIIFGFIFF